MAWIESHQSLANHPKTRKLARLLGVSRVTAIGHLHMLWWWATEYAEDGDLGRFDDIDIAIACDWDGEEARLLDALAQAGFVDDDRRIHDWQEFAGRLIERRRADAERKRHARARPSDGPPPDEQRRPADIQRTGDGHPEDGVRNRTVPNRTVPNQTEPENDDDARARATAPPSVVEHPFALLEALCDELGEDVSVLSKSDKDKQLAAAKRLRDDGLCADDVRKMVRWLRSQAWVTGGIDLFLVEKQKAKWRLAGQPSRAPPANGRASPTRSRQEQTADNVRRFLAQAGGPT